MPTYYFDAIDGTITSTWTTASTASVWNSTFTCTVDTPLSANGTILVDGEAQQRERLEAEETARALAERLLPPDVYQGLARNQGCLIPSALVPGLRYRFPARHDEMITVYGENGQEGRLCFHPAESVPYWDVVLQRYTQLTSDEHEVWRKANLHQGSERCQALQAEMRRG